MQVIKQLAILSFILFTQVNSSFSQATKEKFHLSCPEKWWAFTHPFVLHKVYTMTIEARHASKEMMKDSTLDHDANGGQVDAFRHAYWMALLSQHIAPRK